MLNLVVQRPGIYLNEVQLYCRSVNPQVTSNLFIAVFESLFLPYHPPAKMVTIGTGPPMLKRCRSCPQTTNERTITDSDLMPVLGCKVK